MTASSGGFPRQLPGQLASLRAADRRIESSPRDQPGSVLGDRTLEQPRYTRQDLLRQIETRTGRRVIAYIGGPGSFFGSFDIPPFVDLLHDVEYGADLDLMLQTPGGDVDQAERIVMMCRKKIGPAARLRVVVPDSAKSAGTLIAFTSDAIVMGYCSELGPIDPQISITTAGGEPISRPAQSFLDGLEAIKNDVGDGGLSPAYFPLLDKLDPALIDFCKKAIKLLGAVRRGVPRAVHAQG